MMCKPVAVACLFVLMIGILVGCKSDDQGKAANSSPQVTAKKEEPKPEGQQMQYRAVCTEKEAHGGNEYLLTRWLDSKDKVLPYSREHERKNKSHVVRIDERVKP